MSERMKVISFILQKGGVGKSVSTYNIGVGLSEAGYKTLIIDLDSQGSLTISAGLEPLDYDETIVTVMEDPRTDMNKCILELRENLDICTSRLELAGTEMALVSRPMRETVLKRGIESLEGYDYVLIDAPPQLGLLSINALACSDYVIIPSKTDYLSYRSVEFFLNTIDETIKLINPKLEILGLIATMFNSRANDDKEILEAYKEKYNVLGVTNNQVVAKKGVYDGKSVYEIDNKSQVAKAYRNICKKIIERG